MVKFEPPPPHSEDCIGACLSHSVIIENIIVYATGYNIDSVCLTPVSVFLNSP